MPQSFEGGRQRPSSFTRKDFEVAKSVSKEEEDTFIAGAHEEAATINERIDAVRARRVEIEAELAALDEEELDVQTVVAPQYGNPSKETMQHATPDDGIPVLTDVVSSGAMEVKGVSVLEESDGIPVLTDVVSPVTVVSPEVVSGGTNLAESAQQAAEIRAAVLKEEEGTVAVESKVPKVTAESLGLPPINLTPEELTAISDASKMEFAPDVKSSPEYARAQGEWRAARDRSLEAEKEYQAAYRAELTAIEQESKLGTKPFSYLGRKLFGIQPKPSEATSVLKKAAANAANAYTDAAYALGEARYNPTEKADFEVLATKPYLGGENSPEAHVKEVMERYQRMLARKVVIKPLQERTEIQRQVLEENADPRVQNVLKWGTRAMRTKTAAVIAVAGMTVGAPAIVPILGAIGAGVAAGAGTKWALNKLWVDKVAAKQAKGLESTKRSLFDTDFADIEAEYEKNARSLDIAKRTSTGISIAAGMAAGYETAGGLGSAGTQEVLHTVQDSSIAALDKASEAISQNAGEVFEGAVQSVAPESVPVVTEAPTFELPADMAQMGYEADLKGAHEWAVADASERADIERVMLKSPEEIQAILDAENTASVESEVIATPEIAVPTPTEAFSTPEILHQGPSEYTLQRGDDLWRVTTGELVEGRELPASLADLPEAARNQLLSRFFVHLNAHDEILHEISPGSESAGVLRAGAPIDLAKLDSALSDFAASEQRAESITQAEVDALRPSIPETSYSEPTIETTLPQAEATPPTVLAAGELTPAEVVTVQQSTILELETLPRSTFLGIPYGAEVSTNGEAFSAMQNIPLAFLLETAQNNQIVEGVNPAVFDRYIAWVGTPAPEQMGMTLGEYMSARSEQPR